MAEKNQRNALEALRGVCNGKTQAAIAVESGTTPSVISHRIKAALRFLRANKEHPDHRLLAIYASRPKPLRPTAKVNSRRRQLKALEVYLERGSISAVSRVIDINFQSADVLIKRAVKFLMDNPGHPKTDLLLRYKAKEMAKT